MTIVYLLLLSTSYIAMEDDASDKYIKMIQGSYEVITLENSGIPESSNFISRIKKFTIDGNKLSMTIKTNNKVDESSISIAKIDTSETPVQVDLKGEKGAFKGMIAKGIIVIENDIIKICCASNADIKRPNKFKTSMDDKSFLIVIKRLAK